MHNHNIYKSLLPVLLLAKFLGLFPFTVVYKNAILDISISAMIWSFIIISFSTFISIVFLFQDTFHIHSKDSILIGIIGTLNTTWLSLVTLIIISSRIIYIEQYKKVLYGLYLCETKLKELQLNINYKNISFWAKILVIPEFILISILTCISSFLLNPQDKQQNHYMVVIKTCSYFFFLQNELLLAAEFCTLIIYTQMLISGCNNYILKYSSSNYNHIEERTKLKHNTRTYQNDFLIVSKIHGLLCHSIRKINKVYSFQLIIYFAHTFQTILIHAYSICVAIYFRHKYFNITIISFSSTIIILLLLKIWTFAKFGTDCKNSIKESKQVLLTISKNKNLKAMIHTLTLQIMHEEVTVSAAGFFPIEFTMITAIFGSASTYVIMLLQFDPNVNIFQ